MALLDDAAFEAYKRRMVPVLYDWFTHYHLSYPTQTCRWGSKVEEHPYKTRYRAYLSEQAGDSPRPNTLILAHIDVLKPHVASCEAVSNWQEKSTSPYVHISKTIYHPGEVNKVREMPTQPDLLVTHTDSEKLYVWNIDRQQDRRPAAAGVAAAAGKARARSTDKSGSASTDPSTPDLVLVGHEEQAPFPLACSAVDPRVASGGEDCLVLLWDLGDHVTSLTSAEGGAAGARKAAPELNARHKLKGHTDTIGDLVFQPSSSAVLMSVADDGCIKTWDVRAPGAGGEGEGADVATVSEAHGRDVNVMCVDWCALDENMVVTGAQDGSLRVWDRRRMSSAAEVLHCLNAHRNAPSRDIIHVEWHPACKDVFASGSEDHTVAIWNLAASERSEPASAKPSASENQPDAPSADAGAEAGSKDAAAAAAAAASTSGEAAGEKQRAKRPRGAGAKDVGGAGGKGGAAAEAELPAQLVFQHLGHRFGRVTDFQWHPSEQWTIISVSDNSGVTDDGADGSLQVWRIMDLIYRPLDEAVQELEKHRQFIMHGSLEKAKDKDKAPKPEPAS